MVYGLLHALATILIILIPSAPSDFQDLYTALYINVCAKVSKLVLQTHRSRVESCHSVFVKVYY